MPSLIRPMNGIATAALRSPLRKLVTKQPVRANHAAATVQLTDRYLCDLWLLEHGGFNPLKRFMNKEDYTSVLKDFRLADGQLFPLPVTLPVTADALRAAEAKDNIITLTDPLDRGIVAQIHVDSSFTPDLAEEARLAFADGDSAHPENKRLKALQDLGNILYVTGEVTNFTPFPMASKEYEHLVRTPAEVKADIQKLGHDRVVFFQTRNPMHRAHIECVKRAAADHNCHIHLHPVCGPTKEGDISYQTRVECYQQVRPMLGDGSGMSLLPLAMRMGGPREAMLHAIIRRNFGATHFIVGRDHAGPGKNSKGEDMYDPAEAAVFVKKHESELGITIADFPQMIYCLDDDAYHPKSEIPEGAKTANISGTEVRRRLVTGAHIPAWFSPEPVVSILRRDAALSRSFDPKLAAEGLQDADPQDIIRLALEMYGDNCAISFSGAEDVYLIELAQRTGLPFRVFSLDTARLHPETYELFNRVEEHYGIRIEYCLPDTKDLSDFVQEKGLFSFFEDGHKECCTVRKVDPLRRKLATLDAWITGVRKDQSETRDALDVVAVDTAFKGQGEDGLLVKFNPLAEISSRQVWNGIKESEVPFNDLHLKGFVSIGCAPCTRPVHPGMHEREGRWWWEDSAAKECGLHPQGAQGVWGPQGGAAAGGASASPAGTRGLSTWAAPSSGRSNPKGRSSRTMSTATYSQGTGPAPGINSVLFVKKVMEDGSFCRKCDQVSAQIEKFHLENMITETVVADVREPESEGFKLAEELKVDRAPFFVVDRANGDRDVIVNFLDFKKQALRGFPSK